MKTKYTSLILVPARNATARKELAEPLAQYIVDATTESDRIVLLAMPEGLEEGVRATACLLSEALALRRQIATSLLVFGRAKPLGEPVTTEDARAVLQLFTKEERQCTVLVIVIELEYAQKLPALFLAEYLGAKGIRTDLDMRLEPGTAAIIDCESQSRNQLPALSFREALWKGSDTRALART